MLNSKLLKFCSFLLAGSLLISGGIWANSALGSSSNTGVQPPSAGGTGTTSYVLALDPALADSAASSLIHSNLTADRLLSSNTSGKIGVMGAGTTEDIVTTNSSIVPAWASPKTRFDLAVGSLPATTYTISNADWAKFSAFDVLIALDYPTPSYYDVKHFNKSSMVNSSTSANTRRDGLLGIYQFSGNHYTIRTHFNLTNSGQTITLGYGSTYATSDINVLGSGQLKIIKVVGIV